MAGPPRGGPVHCTGIAPKCAARPLRSGWRGRRSTGAAAADAAGRRTTNRGRASGRSGAAGDSNGPRVGCHSGTIGKRTTAGSGARLIRAGKWCLARSPIARERHCRRSEAISRKRGVNSPGDCFAALAMTARPPVLRAATPWTSAARPPTPRLACAATPRPAMLPPAGPALRPARRAVPPPALRPAQRHRPRRPSGPTVWKTPPRRPPCPLRPA